MDIDSVTEQAAEQMATMIARSNAWLLLTVDGDGKLNTLTSRPIEKWIPALQEMVIQVEQNSSHARGTK